MNIQINIKQPHNLGGLCKHQMILLKLVDKTPSSEVLAFSGFALTVNNFFQTLRYMCLMFLKIMQNKAVVGKKVKAFPFW